jgi:DNA-binding MarR family transcriptional regulator
MRSYQFAVDVFDDAVAGKLGINRTDFRCLDILDQQQPMTAGSLARATRLSTGAITFALDRLEASGFVRRRRDEGDRRRVLVELVPSAQEKVTALHIPMVMDARKSLAGFTDHEIEVVCRFLDAGKVVFERNVPG